MVSKMIQAGLRVWQLLCSIIIMGLVGNMIATAFAGNPSSVNYIMFVSVFGVLSLIYLLPVSFMGDFGMPIVNIALDALNAIFWFCGAVAFAALLRVHSCGNSDYTHSNHITNGSHDTGKRCHEAQASTAFLWFGWVAFMGTLAMSVMAGSGSGVNMRGIRRGGPSMSQV